MIDSARQLPAYGLLPCVGLEITQLRRKPARPSDELLASSTPWCLALAADLFANEMISGRLDRHGMSYSNAYELHLTIDLRGAASIARWRSYYLFDTPTYQGVQFPLDPVQLSAPARKRIESCISLASKCLWRLDTRPHADANQDLRYCARWKGVSNHQKLELERYARTPIETLLRDRVNEDKSLGLGDQSSGCIT
jgi:hypothetical protein